jgi:hypothetical protein
MDILNSYLNAVRSCLPDVQRDDIINELSENLHSEIEDQQASLGRPLTDAEIEAILKQHGHPFVVAGRYREDQRSLSFGREIIGPALFPFYVRVLLFNLGITSGIQLIVFLALFLSRQVVTASSFFPALFYGAAIQFAVVTLIFSIADRHFHKHPDRWSPRTLKQPWHPAFAIKGEPKRASSRVSRFDSVAQIIALAVGLIWLRVAQGAPFLIFGPAAAFLRPAPVWHQFYWPVVILALLGIVQALVNVVRPDWLRVMVVYRALTAAAWIVILFLLIRAGHWVVLAGDGPHAENLRHTADILNQITIYSAAGFTVVAIYNFVRHLRRLLRLSGSGSETLRKSANHA